MCKPNRPGRGPGDFRPLCLQDHVVKLSSSWWLQTSDLQCRHLLPDARNTPTCQAGPRKVPS